MAIKGYLFVNTLQAKAVERAEELRSMIRQTEGCTEILEDSAEQEKLRPQWHSLLSNLKRGDTIVIAKLSNALRGIRELGAFLSLCSSYDIRLISLLDKIDTAGILYPETSPTDVLNTIGKLSSEVATLRRGIYKGQKIKSLTKARTLKAGLKMDREKTVVRMYAAGHHINEIWHATGYKSRTSVFRVLKRNGVELNRGKRKE